MDFLRFYWSLARQAPHSAWSAFKGVATLVGVLGVTAAIVLGAQAAIDLSDWKVFSPFVAAVLLAVLFVYGLMQANYDDSRRLERERDQAVSELAALEERKPLVRFGEPYVRQAGVVASGTDWIGYANFVVVPVVNERPPQGASGESARHVHGTVAAESLDGTALLPPLAARWDETPQPPDRGAFAPTSAPDLAELTLSPNGRPHGLDTVMHFIGDGTYFVWNNDSMKTAGPLGRGTLDDRYKISDLWFILRVRIEGSNVEPVETAFRVQGTFAGPRVTPEVQG